MANRYEDPIKVYHKGTVLEFESIGFLVMHWRGKFWILDKASKTSLRFCPMSKRSEDCSVDWLRDWRKEQLLNQTEAAKVLGVSPSLIAKIESGKRTMPPEILDRIFTDMIRCNE